MEAKYRSDDISSLIASLAKAQGSYKPLIPNEDCPGGKFANLKAIMSAVGQALSENGLAFYQYIELQDEGSGASLLKTIIAHSSGQFISSASRLVPGSTERQTGNIYEIHKRRHATMLLGIAPSENDPVAYDDNGEELSDKAAIERERKNIGAGAKREINRSDVINTTEYNDLIYELEGYEETAKDIMEKWGIETLADLPKQAYRSVRNHISTVKKQLEYSQRRK